MFEQELVCGCVCVCVYSHSANADDEIPNVVDENATNVFFRSQRQSRVTTHTLVSCCNVIEGAT